MIKISKPKFDNRDYVGGILKNNIKYIIINDTHLEKSYISVCIKTGSYANPKTHNGLAHFLEHMLFMGSKKYPNENHFNKRLNELGGYTNAYTDVTETVYYFNVFDHGLVEMMDIFSRFFIDPLFDPDAVSREINAVNNEHKKNINDDMWKKFQLNLYLADPNSNVNTFVTGSHNTLKKESVRREMIDFYNDYYKSSNISICVASSLNHNEVKNIIDTTFGNIEKEQGKEIEIIKPFYKANISKTFYLETTSNIYELTYLWEIPEQKKLILSKDFTILQGILNNRSESSLFFVLKNLGYLHYLNVEIRNEGIFNLTFRLTKNGFNNRDYIETILFDYLNKIYQNDLNKYAKYYQKVCDVNFNCLNKFDTSDLCNILSVNHHYYDTKDSFDGGFLIKKIKNSKEYEQLFKTFINKNNFIRVLASKDYDISNLKLTRIKLREYETYYTEIKYNHKNLAYDDKFNLCCFEPSNDYLDLNQGIIQNLDKYDKPVLLGEKQWFGGNTSHNEPLINIWLQFTNSIYFSSAKNYVLTNISSTILNFLINTIMSKPLELCYGISFDSKPSTSSLVVNIRAPNDITKLHILVSQFCDFMLDLDRSMHKITDDHIKNLMVSFKEAYMNTNFLNPWEYLGTLITSKAYSTEYSIDELITALDSITYTEIRTYINSILNKTTLTSFIYGNVDPISLNNLFRKLNKLYFNNIYPLPTINTLKNITVKHPNELEKSNCIAYYYPIGKFLPKEFILINLITTILSEPFFDNIRTKDQLGYLVKMSYTNYRDEYFIIQKIQSDKSVKFVEDRLKLFNSKIMNMIKSIDIDKFILTLRKQITEPDTSLSEKFLRYLPEISLRQYLFNRKDLLLLQLDKITRDDVKNFIKKYINNNNRVKVIINGN